ncbi:hypothetical protein EON63_05115 [archaeon]|nr:MAG: hypothetical protein EON63_05115 [archaeon]
MPILIPSPISYNREAEECTPCPYGRYRSTQKGKSADDCNKCPIGTYANVTGTYTN